MVLSFIRTTCTNKPKTIRTTTMKIAMIDSSSQQKAATATREAETVAGTTAGTTTVKIRTATLKDPNDDDKDLLITAATAAEEDHETIMNRAMGLLPDELTFEYRQACRFVPELVDKESDLRWFLSFHPSDPLAAARRLANYWKKRKEIFQERAYLPINLSGNGAMTADDVKVLKMGYMVNLPRDLKGRTVVFIDMSKKNPETKPSSRTTLFVGQCLMENVKSRTDCYVGVYNISNPYAVGFDRESLQESTFLIRECLPLKQYTMHLCYISPPGMNIMPLFINTVFAWAINFLSSFYGKSIYAHVASSKGECLSKLLENGDFSPYALPVSLGGSWPGGCEPWRCSSRRSGNCRRTGESPSAAASTATGSGGTTSVGCNNDDDDGASSNDDEELNLEIETDLSCLLRNSLWLHSQTLSSGDGAAEVAVAPLGAGSQVNHEASSSQISDNEYISKYPDESEERAIKRTRRVVHSKGQDELIIVAGAEN